MPTRLWIIMCLLATNLACTRKMPRQRQNTASCAAASVDSGALRPAVFTSEGRNPAMATPIIEHAKPVKNQCSAAALFRMADPPAHASLSIISKSC